MIVAEIGLNHMGDRKMLEHFLYTLTNSKVDAITLQIRESEFYENSRWEKYRLVEMLYVKASKQVRKSGKQFGLAISDKHLIPHLRGYCDFFKILSKDLSDTEILNTFKNSEVKCYLSTGNSSFDQIEEALKYLNSNTTLIHTRLDNGVDKVNLSAIKTMKNTFSEPIAFGNHCQNLNVIYAAIPFQPSDYFFYVKDNTYEVPPDDKHAIDLQNVDKVCQNIVQLNQSIGSGLKYESENSIEGQL